MREITVPPLIERPELRSVCDLLDDRMRVDPEHVSFGRHLGGHLVDVTVSEFRDQATALAKGLAAAGVQPGDRVAIMSQTRYEWAVADFAIWAAGGVVVPVYETSSTLQVAGILSRSEARWALAGNAAQAAVIAAAAPDVAVWTFDEGHDLAALVALGAQSGIADEEIERRRAIAGPDDLASIVFSSGTTGEQKGVLITHGNFVRLVLQVGAAYSEVVTDRATTIILLPLAHILAQGLQLVSIHAGMKVIHESDPKSAVAAMGEVRPTFMVVVPRILEKIRSAARAKAAARRLGGVFASAERTAIAWGEHLERAQHSPGLAPPRGLAIRHAFYDRLFYGKLRALMGGRIDYLLSGASPLDADLCNFYAGISVPVIEGYGLTETTAPVTGIRVGGARAGSVGRPIPGSTVKISDDGEVLVRGVGVSPGYLDPEHDVAHVDGFFHTGDLGTLDEDGFLFLKGRLKNILVTANGKNVAPEPWEALVATHPVVAHALLVGEGRSYVAALVLLDIDEAIAWARCRGLGDLAGTLHSASRDAGPDGVRITDEALRGCVQCAIDRANSTVSSAEQVRRFTLLVASPSEADQTLTPTLKLRREQFLAAASHHVNDLYDTTEGTR